MHCNWICFYFLQWSAAQYCCAPLHEFIVAEVLVKQVYPAQNPEILNGLCSCDGPKRQFLHLPLSLIQNKSLKQ